MTLLIALIVGAVAGVWVHSDAKARGKTDGEALMWGILTFALLIVGLPLWLATRPALPGERPQAQATPRAATLCPHCGKYYDGAPSFCPNCGAAVKAEVRKRG